MREKTNNFRQRLSLRAVLITAFLTITAALLLASSIYQIYYLRRAQREAVSSQQLLIAQEAATAVNGFIQDNFDILETAVSLSNITQMDSDELERFLGITLSFQSAFRQLVLYDADGHLLAQTSRLSRSRLDDLVTLLEEESFAPIKQPEQYISPVIIDEETNEPLVVLSVPVLSSLQEFQGTIVAELNLKFMWSLVDQLKIGETGFAYVVDRQGNLLAYKDTARVLLGENVSYLTEVSQFIAGENETAEEVADIEPGITGEESVQTYVPLGTPDWAVVVELPSEEAFRPLAQGTLITFLVQLGLWIFAGLSGLMMAYRLAAPLNKLTETAVQIADGNFDLRAEIDSPIEVTQLANAFNQMTSQLKELIDSLEQRVAARTQALETSGEISRQISTILERQELVKKVVELIQQSFNYYQAQIFLFDDAKENLVMVSGTGEGAQKMLANRHQIAIGKGLVGRAGQTGQPVLVSDTSQADDWLPNPLLPDTKAETAVPIMSGEQIYGVLDVQQNVTGGLEQSDVALLESIANQVAVALRNANLYDEAQKQAEREALLNQINQQILQTTDMQTALKVAVRELGRATGSAHTRVHLKTQTGHHS
ncbi:MAG: GAF domain-containing protein [Ardenticatenaceae bacterium]|nr:GAF domain-containing protein [Ardenticatenaceae bacterium]